MPHEWIALSCPAVVHPFSVAPRFDQSCTFQARQVPRHLRLDDAKGIGQLADAGFAAAQQIKQAQPSWIGQGFKKPRRSVSHLFRHRDNTYMDKRIYVNQDSNGAVAVVAPPTEPLWRAKVQVQILGRHLHDGAAARGHRLVVVSIAV